MKKLVIPKTAVESMEFKQWLADKEGFFVDLLHPSAYGYGVIETDKDEIVGAVVLEPFHTHGDILMACRGEDPDTFFSRKIIYKVLRLPFEDPFNAHRVTLMMNNKYYRAVEVALRLGFRSEGILSHHYGEGEECDAVIMSLLRSQVRGV